MSAAGGKALPYQIAERLASAGYQVQSLGGKAATEEALKQNIEGARIVHLATHGFFLNEIKVPLQVKAESLSGENPKININNIFIPSYHLTFISNVPA